MKEYKKELAEYKESLLVKGYINDTLFNRKSYFDKKTSLQNRVINSDSFFANKSQNRRAINLKQYPKDKADIKLNFSRIKFNNDLTKGDFFVDFKGKFTSDTIYVTVIKVNNEWRINKIRMATTAIANAG